MTGAEGPVPVLAVATSRYPLLHNVVGIARSLGRIGVPVHVAHQPGRVPADASRYLRGRFPVRYDEADPDRFVADLRAVGHGLGGPAVLVPVDDAAALTVDDHAEELAGRFVFPRSEPGLARALASKKELYRLCRRHGIPAPETVFPVCRADVEAYAARAVFLVVAKAIDPLRMGRAADPRSVVLAATREELLEAYQRMETPEQPNVMLQEFIPGGPESIWMFNGYFDDSSKCLISFTGTKIRQWPVDTGPTTLGVCLDNPTVQQAAEEFLGEVGYRGIVDLGFRYDRRDGRYKLLDVNPRIGGTFRLFTAEDGTDVARALYRDLVGEPVSRSVAPQGRRWVVEQYDLLAARRLLRSGRLSVREWAGSYRGVREGAWFARDDPAPFAALVGWCAALAVRQAVQPRRHRATAEAVTAPASGSTGQPRWATAHFEAHAEFWQDVYRGGDVFSMIHRHRQEVALGWVDRLGLAPGSDALEVGCGAGLATVALAARGLRVQAIDAAPAMVERARQRIAADGLGQLASVSLADAHRLPFRDDGFPLVLALGVLPWVDRPDEAVREMARVLRPGGFLVFTADNRARLTARIDPLTNPALRPVRTAARAALVGAGLVRPVSRVRVTLHRRTDVDRMLEAAGLERVTGSTLGFGPFTLLGRQLLPEPAGVRVDATLQRLADRGLPIVRSGGTQHFVVARKRGVAPA